MGRNFQYQFECGLYFFYKKHYCQKCNNILEKEKSIRMVDSNSEEGKSIVLTQNDVGPQGEIELIRYNFYCPNCETKYTIKELKALEKEKRSKRL